MASFNSIIKEAGFRPYKYSGRGMNGDHCVGFNVDERESTRWIGVLIQAARYDEYPNTALDILEEALSEFRTDSMGKGQVIYFPEISWEQASEDEQGEEDDGEETDGEETDEEETDDESTDYRTA